MKTIFGSLFFILTPIFAENFENSVISANNRFAADIYKELVKNQEANFLVSPFSVESGLAFVQSGARGQTAEEIRTTLHLPLNQSQIENDFKHIFPSFESKYDLYSFNSANKLYLDKKNSIKDNFRKTGFEAFNTDLENVEFSKSVEAAKAINQWVEEKTDKKIRDFVDPHSLDPDTVAVIINPVYLKGFWRFPVDKAETRKKDFYHIDKRTVPVDTMCFDNSEIKFLYGEDQKLNAKFLELPIQGGDIAMVLVLPNEKDGIAELENQIHKVFSFNNFTKEYVKVLLPKFKIEGKIDVKMVLQNLGVKKAFVSGEADFTGISDNDLHINQAIQKTSIKVDERGVEAAASFFLDALLYDPIQAIKEPKEFIVDHPFIFFIKIEDLIIFAGRVGEPLY